MKLFGHSMFAHITEGFKRHRKTILLTTSAAIATILILASGSWAYLKVFENKIYPGVVYGGVNLSGLTQEQAIQVLDDAYQSMLNRGLPVRLGSEDEVIELRVAGATDPDLFHDLVYFDPDVAATQALNLGRTQSTIDNLVTALTLPVLNQYIEPDFTIAETQLADTIHSTFADQEDPGQATDFDITMRRDEILIDIIAGRNGRTIDTDAALAKINQDLSDFELETLELTIDDADDVVTLEEATALEDAVRSIIQAAPYKLVHTSAAQRDYSWTISDDDVADWMKPQRLEDGTVDIRLDLELMTDLFEEIRDDVDTKPKNARFVIEDGRVEEFAGSIDGESFNEETTVEKLLNILGEADAEVSIVVDVVEPEITTGSVNDLGIKEILGVGVSDFSGSPYNRVQNIKNGASKLNGLLIPPGETVSLIEELGPFTSSNGYLSELVIKGDEIKPEMGGGLCQIGTTTFRAVMNSGLEVTERRNHSLVVSYYNDASNGNPGTDATIYDPAPDFKFTNDYENHILLMTEVNALTGDLVFTFWGTDDGRNGYYTAPVVLSWAGYGATIEKETPDLAPGVRRCQSPHPGATASFDYIVEYADGSKFEKNYTSVYRSLPMICLVGAGEEASEGDGEDGEKSASDPDAPEKEIPPADPLELDDVPTPSE